MYNSILLQRQTISEYTLLGEELTRERDKNKDN
jgi:hypothetical protein